MRWISAVACLAVAGMCLPVEAQVHRCKDAAGKTIYSDAPCTSGQTGQLIEREKSREQILEERLQAAQANERKYRMQDAEQSSKIYEQQRQSRPLNTQPPVPQNLASSRECKAAQKELEFVSSIRTLPQNEKRLRTNAAITNVNASCGSKTELMTGASQGHRSANQYHALRSRILLRQQWGRLSQGWSRCHDRSERKNMSSNRQHVELQLIDS